MRLVVGDGSLLFRLAIGRRFILALSHCGVLATDSGSLGEIELSRRCNGGKLGHKFGRH
jgi:hypothetical protein